MNRDLERIAARTAIQDLLFRYCRGIDRADADLVRSVYHPGATDDHGVFSGDAHEFADFVIPMLTAEYTVTQHQLSNMLIEIDLEGDPAAARSETYFTAYHRERNSPGAKRMVVFGGRYLDRLERRDGRWGIVERVVVHDWSDAYDLELHPALDSFAQGTQDESDPSARLFRR